MRNGIKGVVCLAAFGISIPRNILTGIRGGVAGGEVFDPGGDTAVY